jgi:sodium/hydrogen antiporter
MNEWALPTVAVLLLVYWALSARLQTTVVTQAMVFVAFGLLVGDRVVHLVDVEAANQFVRLLAEATLTLVLFTDAVRVNLGSLRHGRPCRYGCSGSVCRSPLSRARWPAWSCSPS